MDSADDLHIAAALAQRIRAEADAVPVGDALVSIWRDIDAALSPIFGVRGIAALYVRSLQIAGADHPWLVPADTSSVMDLEALKSVVVEQSPSEAVGGGAALMHAICGMLVTLVGPALTERLLRPVLDNHSCGPLARDRAS